MRIFEANITLLVSNFLNESLKEIVSIDKANQKMYDTFGIIHFFDNENDLQTLKETISETQNLLEEPNRAEYGDFQTNEDLANKVTLNLVSKNISPKVIIEPTCGKGNFIIASLKNFNNISGCFWNRNL